MTPRRFRFTVIACLATSGVSDAAIQYFSYTATRNAWNGSNWSTTSGGAAGTTYTGAWSGYNEAVLEGSGGSVSGGGAVNKWTFSSDGYILTGGFTMGSPLAANFIIPNAAHTATVSGGLSVANGDNILWKDGAGKLVLSGNHTTNKFVAEQGTLEMTAGSLTVNTASHTQAIKGFFIGKDSGSTTKAGTFLLTGGNLTVNAGNMILGAASNGATKVAQFTQSGGTATINGSLIVASGGTSQVDLTGGTLTTNSVARNSGTGTLNFDGGTLKAGAASSTFLTGLTATTIKTGGAKIDTNNLDITIGQALIHDSGLGTTPDGGLIKNNTGTLTLTGVSTYTGPTTVNAGTLALSGAGSIAASSVIDVATNATLQGGTFGSGQTVRGTGKLAGSLTIGAGGLLSPAGDATTGAMEIVDTLNLGGTVRMQIVKSAGGALSGDQFTGAGSVACGGTLEVTASGEPLEFGDSIQLFANTGGFSNSFASVSLPPLTGGLAWNYSSLATNGTITVGNALSAPLFSPVGGGYLGSRSVTLTADSGATIFYTTDGTEPTAASPSATSPVTGLSVPVDTTTTIKAFARKAGITDSPVVTATYATLSTARWNVDDNGLWSESAKWLSQAIPDGPGAPVDFYSTHQSAASTITLDSNRTVGSITFGNDEPISWTLGATNGSILTLAGTTAPAITVQSDITTISAPITGTQGLAKLGEGTLKLTGQNTLSGGVTVNAGTLVLQRFQTGPYITGPMVVNSGATLTFTNSTGTTLDGWGNALTIHGGTANTTGSNAVWYGSLDITGGAFNANCSFYGMNVTTHAAATTATITGGSAPYSVNHTFAVEDGAAATDLSVSTPLGGTGTLTKSGAGALTLTAANSYTGATSVNAGALLVTGSTHASSSVAVAASATLGGTGTAAGSVTAAGTIAPGATGIGTFATGTATLTGTYACQIDGATTDRWNVAGNLNLTGATLAVSEINPATFTSAVIATYTGTLTGTFTPSPALPTGVIVQYDAATKEIRLVKAQGYDSWLAEFTFAPGADTTSTGDPDGDGLTNQQEYAFGLNPTDGSSANPITGSLNKANATFTYIRRKPSLTGLTYKVWTSPDLATWTEDTAAQQTATDQGNNQSVLVTLSAPTPLSASKLFVRCSAE